jgi:hypothetical protein
LGLFDAKFLKENGRKKTQQKLRLREPEGSLIKVVKAKVKYISVR